MANLLNGLGGAAGFGENTVPINDDGNSGAIDITDVMDGPINFFGVLYDEIYINNNGNVTFGSGLSAYSPGPIGDSGIPGIYPYWADVDTRGGPTSASPGGTSTGSNRIYYDLDDANDRIVITWDDVGRYNSNNSLTNAFQLIITGESDAPDRAAGDFDFEMRYEAIEWTNGSASSQPARAGWVSGNPDGDSFEIAPSGDNPSMLTIEDDPGNTGADGVWQFTVRNGCSPGDDVFFGGAISDIVSGCEGDDTLFGGDGGDALFGDEDDDLLYGGNDNDFLSGATGDDVNYGGSGDDFVAGGSGEDRLFGDGGEDEIYGRQDNDSIFGGGQSDALYGSFGSDFVQGGQGDDMIFGGKGFDKLQGSKGDDMMTGGAGNDTFQIKEDWGTDTVTDWGNGNDKMRWFGVTFGDMDISQNGADTVVTSAGFGATFILEDTDASSINASDFIFS